MSAKATGASPLSPVLRCDDFRELRIWLSNLDEGVESDNWELLDEFERARAARFVFPVDRRRYVASHAVVRRLLAAQTGRPAGSLEFREGQFGKPYLVGEPTCSFNVSHSHEVGVVAISDEGNIGVDVETLRNIPDAEALARDNFTLAEQRTLAQAAPLERDLRFLSGWTRKEACLKATGTGLSVHPTTFEVGLTLEPRTLEIRAITGSSKVSVESFCHGSTILIAVARTL